MDDAFESNDREQPASNRGRCNGAEDYQTEEPPCVPATLALEKEFGAGYVSVHGRHCEEGVNEWRRAG